MARSEIRLPKGWNSELVAIDQQIADKETEIRRISAEMEAEIERVRQSYADRLSYADINRLKHERTEEAWQRIRDQHPITPPTMVSKFETYQQAAEVLAHYWQGEEIDHEKLLKGISGGGVDPRLNPRAFTFAQNLTQPGSPERNYVRKAQDFLWKDYGK